MHHIHLEYNATHEKYTLYMYYKKKTDKPCKPGDPSCGGIPPQCTEVPAQTLTGKVMDPQAKGSILATMPVIIPQTFDVLQGIPTSEHWVKNAEEVICSIE